jgi:hypothetical protein
MSKYKISTREADAQWRNSPLAKQLATVADAPKGLSETEALIWVDAYNSVWVINGATPAQAKAAAFAFIAASDVDNTLLEKFDDQD